MNATIYHYYINLLKPSGYFTYQVKLSQIAHGAHIALCVVCGSENKQQLVPYTSLSDWFL